MSRQLNVDDARLLFEYWCRVRTTNEALWLIEWHSYTDPFTAVKQYCSNEARERRQEILKPWQKSKDAYERAKHRNARHA